MDDEIIGRFEIDPFLQHYQTFLNEEWNLEVAAIVRGTKLEKPLTTLIVNWKAAANTHSMPWLLIHSLHHFWHGAVKHQNLSTQLINALANGLPNRMVGKTSNMTRKKIAQAVRDIAAEVEEALNNNPDPEMEPEALWHGYINPTSNLEFQAAIWGSQRLAFGALFFAFEHFMANLVAIGLGKDEDKYSPNWEDVVKDAKKVLDPAIVSKYLDSEFIAITRLTRNCLTHRAGKISPVLQKKDHGLLVDEYGVIQITPSYNHQCIRQLESRLMAVIEAAVKLSEFQRAPETAALTT